MVFGREEGLEYEVCVDEMRLEQVLEFKYLGYVLDDADCCRKGMIGKRVAVVIRSLVNVRGLQLGCARILQLLHETLLMPVLMYGKRRSLRLRLYRWTTSEIC